MTDKKRISTKKKKPAVATTAAVETIDYRRREIPQWIKDLIEKHVALELGDGVPGPPGFMARALVQATMPYKDPKTEIFTRRNGDFTLRILAGYEGGIPFGVYPRLLMSWIATEAVRTQSPRIELGSSLAAFLRDVLDLSRGGGPRGSASRVAEQMKRLFGSLITAQYGGTGKRSFNLKNIMLADDAHLSEDFEDRLSEAALAPPAAKDPADSSLWVPQSQEEAGRWDSHVVLTHNFFIECLRSPVPINLAAYKDLRGSPMAMDIYSWLTYRMSYLTKRSRPIPWAALMAQFGSNFTTDSAIRDFKKAFLQALKAVKIVYPRVNVEPSESGLVLLPSPTHVPKLLSKPTNPTQTTLF